MGIGMKQGPKNNPTQKNTRSNNIPPDNSGIPPRVRSNGQKNRNTSQMDSQRDSQMDSQRNSQMDSQRNSKRDSQRNSKSDSQMNSQRGSQRDSQRGSQRDFQRNSQRDSQRDSQRNSQRDLQRNSQRDLQRGSSRDRQTYKRNTPYDGYDEMYDDDENFLDDGKTLDLQNKKLIMIGGAIIIVILIGFGIFYFVNSNKKNDETSTGSTTTKTEFSEESTYSEEEEETTTEMKFQVGEETEGNYDYEEGQKTTVDTPHSSSTDYLKDLDGNEISENYTVQNITKEVDYANYEEKRATIDAGMEFYWVELEYKGKKYRAQCSYNMFRQLDSSGICKVGIELLTLDTGQQAISYMKVVPDTCTVDDLNNNPYF